MKQCMLKTRGKVLSWEYRSLRKRNSRPPASVILCCPITFYYRVFMVKDDCLKFVYIGKNRRFTAFLDSNLHTRLAIVTGNELGLAFPPRNLPKKLRPDPSTFYLVIVVTNRQTNKQTAQTYASDSIILAKAFAGIIKYNPGLLHFI